MILIKITELLYYILIIIIKLRNLDIYYKYNVIFFIIFIFNQNLFIKHHNHIYTNSENP